MLNRSRIDFYKFIGRLIIYPHRLWIGKEQEAVFFFRHQQGRFSVLTLGNIIEIDDHPGNTGFMQQVVQGNKYPFDIAMNINNPQFGGADGIIFF